MPQYLQFMVKLARAAAVMIVALSLTLAGCAASKVTSENCVPRMRIEPATVHPGDSITVQSADSCKVKIPVDGWVVVAGHVGAGKALVQVKRSAEFNGSFRVELTLPSDFPVGEAYAGVDDDKRAAILTRRARGESIRTIAAAVGVSIGVIHKTLTQSIPRPNEPARSASSGPRDTQT